MKNVGLLKMSIALQNYVIVTLTLRSPWVKYYKCHAPFNMILIITVFYQTDVLNSIVPQLHSTFLFQNNHYVSMCEQKRHQSNFDIINQLQTNPSFRFTIPHKSLWPQRALICAMSRNEQWDLLLSRKQSLCVHIKPMC